MAKSIAHKVQCAWVCQRENNFIAKRYISAARTCCVRVNRCLVFVNEIKTMKVPPAFCRVSMR